MSTNGTVWKFDVGNVEYDVTNIDMPRGAEILTIQVQHDRPRIWARVFQTSEWETRRFAIVGTGHDVPDGVVEYVGTVQSHGGLAVWHYFELIDTNPADPLSQLIDAVDEVHPLHAVVTRSLPVSGA